MGDHNQAGALRQIFSMNEAADKANDAAIHRRMNADADATRRAADLECPADLIEWGRAHGIPTFAEVTWCAGFMAGWRAFKTWSDARAMAAAHDSIERADPPC